MIKEKRRRKAIDEFWNRFMESVHRSVPPHTLEKHLYVEIPVLRKPKQILPSVTTVRDMDPNTHKKRRFFSCYDLRCYSGCDRILLLYTAFYIDVKHTEIGETND
jgi:hypothetical protein